MEVRVKDMNMNIRAPPPSLHVKTREKPQERTWDSASFRERDVIFVENGSQFVCR